MFAVQAGEIDRIGELFDRHHRKLYNFFLKLTRHRETSEDLVQDVFVRVLRYRHSYRGGSSFTTWMFRIAYNCFYDNSAKAKQTDTPDEDPDCLPVEPEQLDKVLADEQSCMLQRALAGIPQRDRAILTMSAFHRMKYREIAEVLGCSEGTVKTRVYRSLRQLKKIYTQLTAGGY